MNNVAIVTIVLALGSACGPLSLGVQAGVPSAPLTATYSSTRVGTAGHFQHTVHFWSSALSCEQIQAGLTTTLESGAPDPNDSLDDVLSDPLTGIALPNAYWVGRHSFIPAGPYMEGNYPYDQTAPESPELTEPGTAVGLHSLHVPAFKQPVASQYVERGELIIDAYLTQSPVTGHFTGHTVDVQSGLSVGDLSFDFEATYCP